MKPGEINKLMIRQTLETVFGPEMIEAEFRFHPVRRWRFDYAIPQIKLAIEYDGHGGLLQAGGVSRHGSIIGMTQDAEKFNAAIACGWRVLKFTAFHFRLQDRRKHNLTDVQTTVLNTLAAMQAEIESQGTTEPTI